MGGGYDRYSSASYSKKPSVSAASLRPVAPAAELTSVDKDAMLSSFVHDSTKTGIDVVFSFDTTGSMYPCLDTVRKELETIVVRLLRDIPNIRIALIAHGDYCDGNTYVIKSMDFTTDVQALCMFARDVAKTGGGDLPECYEYALKEANRLSWDQMHSKALVVIGDEIPHAESYTTEKIWWRDEVAQLKNKGVVIYGVQALNTSAAPFYSTIATETGGFHLRLKDFSLITEMFVAVCFRATSAEKFEEYKKQAGSGAAVQEMLSDMAKPTEKKTFNIREAWWDKQYDSGIPSYRYIPKDNKWVVSR